MLAMANAQDPELLDDATLKQLQYDAQEALERRPDRLAASQQALERAIESLGRVGLKPRTRPAGTGDPEPDPEHAKAGLQIGALSSWKIKIDAAREKHPSGSIRLRLLVARQVNSKLLLQETRGMAIDLLPQLKTLLAEIQAADPATRLQRWVNANAEETFIKQEISEVASSVEDIDRLLRGGT
jgi:hypothetical protein